MTISEKWQRNQPKKSLILAHGESGNTHQFFHDEDGEVATLEGSKLTILRDNAALVHEEHYPHTFKKGVGEVKIQREYTMGSLRRVAD